MVLQKLEHAQAVQCDWSKNRFNTSSTSSAECVTIKIINTDDGVKLMNRNHTVNEFHFISLALLKVHSRRVE